MVSSKIENACIFDPAIPLSKINLTQILTYLHKDDCTKMFMVLIVVKNESNPEVQQYLSKAVYIFYLAEYFIEIIFL